MGTKRNLAHTGLLALAWIIASPLALGTPVDSIYGFKMDIPNNWVLLNSNTQYASKQLTAFYNTLDVNTQSSINYGNLEVIAPEQVVIDRLSGSVKNDSMIMLKMINADFAEATNNPTSVCNPLKQQFHASDTSLSKCVVSQIHGLSAIQIRFVGSNGTVSGMIFSFNLINLGDNRILDVAFVSAKDAYRKYLPSYQSIINGMDFGYTPLESANKIAADCSTQYGTEQLIVTNPYKVIGKCYAVKVKIIQLLNEEDALVEVVLDKQQSLDAEQGTMAKMLGGSVDGGTENLMRALQHPYYLHANFGTNGAPVEGTELKIVGHGKSVFRYKTIDKRIKIIPKIDVIEIGR